MANLARRSRVDDDPEVSAPRPPARDADPERRWRFRRNLLIYLAHREGLSPLFIADAFDLSRTLVREIIKDLSNYEGDATAGRPPRGIAPRPAPRVLPRQASPGRRRRSRRDCVIRLAHHRGLSQRFIADVFDLPRSWVSEILRNGPVGEEFPGASPRR